MAILARLTLLLLAAGLFAGTPASADDGPAKIRVACVGDSNTFGAGIPDREKNSYPARLQQLLGDRYEVRNFGVSGCTMLKHGDFPYEKTDDYRKAIAFNPNVVIVALGANDSKPQNWKFKDEFAADTKAMLDVFRRLPAEPRLLLSLPMPAFETMWGINDRDIAQGVIPQLRQVAFETGTEIVDLHTALTGKGDWFPDHIHPNAEGAATMAAEVQATIGFPIDADYNFEQSLADRGVTAKVSSFHGYRQLNFALEGGREVTVVRPYKTAAGRPYAWRGEFFGHEPQTDLALLQRGYHVVYVNAQNLYGGPKAMEIWEAAHRFFNDAGLRGKIVLIGVSRGGLYCYHWAAAHPGTVSVIYGDAPVCDYRSWPAGRLKAPGSPGEWKNLLTVFGFKDDEEALAKLKSPIDLLEPIAAAKIAIIHVVGQADKDVPVEENTDILEKRYRELGGTIEVIRKPNVAHHPHSLPNPAPIVRFIETHQVATAVPSRPLVGEQE